MQATIQKQSVKQDLMLLFLATAITIMFIGYRSTVALPHYSPTSKIEDGEVVVRNDSVITVVIPDKK